MSFEIPWYMEPFEEAIKNMKNSVKMLPQDGEEMTDHEKSIEIKKQAYGAEMNGHIPCQRCGKRGDDVLIVTQWHKRLWNHTMTDLILCAECRNDLAVALKGGEQG